MPARDRHPRATVDQATAGRTRLTFVAIALFVAFILAASGASNRRERVLYGALPMGLALMCVGRVWWLHGKAVIERRRFVWLFRHYAGQQAVRFGYGMKAGGIAFGFLGLWTLAIWLTER